MGLLRWVFFIVSLWLFLLAGVCLQAQTGTSAVTGTVKDQSGGLLAGVAIEVINEETGAVVKTKSNEAGNYRVASLAPGVYTVETDVAGFNQAVRKNLVLTVSQVLAVDLVLQVSGSSQTVEVESSVPLVDSQSSSSGQLISRQMVADLPMPNRAASALVSLAPGAVMIDTGTGAENYPLFSVGGGRARNQNFTLDGGNVTNAVGLTRPMQMTSLPIDAMQEFRVMSNNYSAEHGHSTGGVITLATRSGTNQFHGSVFEYLRNNALDARSFFATEKPPLRRHQFGGTFGGPIRKDKTHFFLSWEQTREASSLPVISTVPTERQRQGDFSGVVDASGRPLVIYDPATTVGKTRQPFSGNVIPQDRIDPVARAVLNYWPQPNRPADASGANNYISNSDSYLQRNIIVAKLDHQLRPSDLLSARYYINDSFTENQGSFGIPESDSKANRTDVRVQSMLLSHTHIVRPNLINEVKASFLQRKFIDKRYGYETNMAEVIGLTGVSAAAFPTFILPGYASLGGDPARIQTPIRDLQILDSVSWYRGKHAFKFGGEYRRGENNEIRDRSSSGNFTFTPLITGIPGTSNTGNALASFLLGEVNTASIQVSDLIPSRASYWAGYVQDDWRVSERLTLNLGLRWETEIPRWVEGNRMNSFDLYAINPVSGTPGIVTFAGQNGVSAHAFRTDLNNWGPRLGFAYRALANTVIRGGAGVFYGSTVSNTIGDTASTGFSTAANFVAPQTDTTSAMQLRNGFPAFVRPPLDAGFGAVPVGKKPYTSVGFFERDRPTPISYQYNFNVQHEAAKDLVLEAGYLANVSHHLTANDLSLNQVPPELMGAGDAQVRRPFPQFSNVYIINPAIGNSTYHAGYIKAEKRFSRGLSFLAHYTFSKFIDDVESSVEYGDTGSYMNAYNRRLDKALSGSDVPHRTILSVLYELRGWPGNRIANALLGRWNIGILTTLQSGAPFTVITSANSTNAFPAGAVRPDVAGDPILSSDERTLQRWFNTAAFVAPQPFQFGNSPRSVLRGDSLQTVDLTLSKTFTLTERIRTDMRGEFYNLLNHTNFNIPGHTLGAADFGVVSSTRAGRAVQLGMRVSF